MFHPLEEDLSLLKDSEVELELLVGNCEKTNFQNIFLAFFTLYLMQQLDETLK